MTGDDSGRTARWAALRERIRRMEEVETLERLIRWYFNPKDHERALRAAWAFSGLRPDAVGRMGEGRFGLFQLTPCDAGLESWDGDLLLNPVRNVAAARIVVDRLGWYAFPAGPVPPPTVVAADMED